MWCLTPLNLSYRCLATWWKNTVLQQALWQALEAHPKVTLRVPTSLIALHRHNDLQELELKGGETILAKLVIGADGAKFAGATDGGNWRSCPAVCAVVYVD